MKDLSLSIRRGRRTAVMGANGSGNPPFSSAATASCGRTKVRYTTMASPSTLDRVFLSLREKVGIVFQDPDMQLFCASVYQEISFGPLNLGLSREKAAREVEAVIRRLGITPFRHRPAHALSGGQKKQVALADILVMHPELLILDEPFAALDPSHVHIIRDMIRDLEKDSSPSGPLTVVIATHDTDFALEWADEVILFSEGQVLAQGAPASVLTDRELLARASLDLPGVIKVFESLQAAGLLGADLPAPKHLDQLTDYIRHTV